MNKNAGNIFKFVLNIVKKILFPYTLKIIRSGGVIKRSAEHDVKIVLLSFFLIAIMFVTSIILWITLGLGIFIFAIYGAGPVLAGWFYTLLFEIATIIVLKFVYDKLQNRFILPKTIKQEFED